MRASADVHEVARVLRLVRDASASAFARLVLGGDSPAELGRQGLRPSNGVSAEFSIDDPGAGCLATLELVRPEGHPWTAEDHGRAQDWRHVIRQALCSGAGEHEARFLRAQNQQLVRAMEQSEDGMILLSPDRRVEWVNDAFLRILDLSRGEVEGSSLTRLMEMYSTLGVLRDLDASCEIGMETSYERMRGRRDGSRLWLSVAFSVVRDEQGEVAHYAAVSRDVTAARERESQLRRLSGAIHASAEGIAVLDDARRVVVANAAFARLHREELPEQLIGVSWFDLLRSWAPLERLHDVEFAVESTQHWAGVFERELPGPGRVGCTVRHAITRLGDGGWIVSAHDVTQEVEMQQALVRARDQAEATSRAQANFVTVVSHELRTPLNAIIGFAGILLKKGAFPEGSRDRTYLGKIEASGRTLLRIVDSILTHARTTSSQVRFEHAIVDLRDVVRDVAEAYRAEASAGGLDLHLQLPATPCLLRLDAQRVRQALGYLVHNAVKFTPHGSVTVRVIVDRDVRVEVEDTGIGIPTERLQDIFKPFFQVEEGTTRGYGGTGLGLTVARSLCDLMGLPLKVRSRVGAGSCFIVHIPDQGPAAQTTSRHVLEVAS